MFMKCCMMCSYKSVPYTDLLMIAQYLANTMSGNCLDKIPGLE